MTRGGEITFSLTYTKYGLINVSSHDKDGGRGRSIDDEKFVTLFIYGHYITKKTAGGIFCPMKGNIDFQNYILLLLSTY